MTGFDLGRYQDPLTIQRVLNTARTIAIVGLSANQLRASYFVGYYLKRHGYRVIPVNPRETEILGETLLSYLLQNPQEVSTSRSRHRCGTWSTGSSWCRRRTG